MRLGSIIPQSVARTFDGNVIFCRIHLAISASFPNRSVAWDAALRYVGRALTCIRRQRVSKKELDMVALTFPDGARRDYPDGTTGLAVAKAISPSLAKRTVAG